MPIVKIKNTNIYFEDEGNGKPLLFISGQGLEAALRHGLIISSFSVRNTG